MDKMMNWIGKNTEKQSERSVLVRHRHNPEQQKVVNKSRLSSKKQVSEKKIPPVLVRGEIFGTPMVNQHQRKLRRKLRLPFNTQGVELSLPSLPNIKIGWRAFSSIITLVMLLLLFIMWTSPQYKVQAAQIQGLQRLNADELNSMLALDGKTIFEINFDDIKEAIEEKFPELTEVEVQVGLPADVFINAKERQAVLSWKQNERTTLVDKYGVGFASLGGEEGILTIYAEESPFIALDEQAKLGQFLPKEVVDSIIVLAKTAPKGVALRFSRMNGLGWDDAQGWKVFFGSDLSNIKQKVLIYQAIAKYVQENGITPNVISVEYIDAPYYHVE